MQTIDPAPVQEDMLPHSYDTSSTAEWPMFVVPFEVLLEKDGFMVHEDLLAEGKLVPWKQGMPTLFVSQVRILPHLPLIIIARPSLKPPCSKRLLMCACAPLADVASE